MPMEDDFSGWIGRTASPETDLITPRLVAAFNATLGPHLYGGDAVPPGLHWCLCPPTAAAKDLGEEGHPRKGGLLPPVPLSRRMWAGGTVTFHAALNVGDTVAKTSTISDITWKDGRSGQLCFVSVDHEYRTDHGVAITERQDIVYTAAAPSAQSPGAARPFGASAGPAAIIPVDEVTLFRYSALTFNAHRIHFDRTYATAIEGYADLVIHGPLQATLLLNVASVAFGQAPKRISYRGLSTATGAQSLRAFVSLQDGGADLFMADENQTPTMRARCDP